MANWTRVIVCWSGIDDEAEGQVDQRAEDIYAAHSRRSGPLLVVRSCPDELAGSACEVNVIFDTASFGVERIRETLSLMAWELPEEVQVLWKSEGMEVYTATPGIPNRLKNED